MARKKRTIQEFEAPDTDSKNKPVYRDTFQQTVGKEVVKVGRKFEGKGKNLLYGLAALVVLVALIGVYSLWNRRNNAAAQTALGKAIETSQAQVTDAPPTPGSTAKTFKTEKERAEAAINEFQTVADTYGGEVRDKAKYFIAVNKMTIDRPAAIAALQELKSGSGEVGAMSKFALAQALTEEGKLDEAAALYQELSQMANPIVAKDTIDFNLAEIYRKQNKIQEASDLYYNIAFAASQKTNSEGVRIPMAGTALLARKKLQEINPAKAKEVPEPAADSNNSPGVYNF